MTTTAGRKAEEARDVRTARIVLLAGTVLAVAAAFGPVWVVRAGVVVALVAGAVACWLMWRTLRAERRAAGERLLAQSRAHGAALHAEREHSTEVLTALSVRLGTTRQSLAEARGALARQRAELADLHHRLATQRGDNAALRARLTRRETEIARLRADPTRPDAARPDADVVAIPRRKAPATEEHGRVREA